MLEWFAGRWPAALEHATAAHELGEQTQISHSALGGTGKALVEADLGLVDEARASGRGGPRVLARRARTSSSPSAASARSAASSSRRQPRGSRRLPARAPRAAARRWHERSDAPVWADAIETLIALGELEHARAYLEALREHARQLGSPWALAAAERCRGLLAPPGAISRAPSTPSTTRSRELERLRYPLERGRTLLCLGVVRRQAQQKRAAREALEEALAIFEELGARLWAEKAQAELRRISGRAAGVGRADRDGAAGRHAGSRGPHEQARSRPSSSWA